VKRVVPAIVLVLALLVAAAPAGAAPKSRQSTAATIASLQKQVTSLQKQVTTLKKQVTFVRNEVAANYVGDECLAASTSDMFQSTWLFVDKISPVFPSTSTSPPVNDKNGCSDIRISRQLPSADTAPTTAIFQNIIEWIG
jgi:hypothetical protein